MKKYDNFQLKKLTEVNPANFDKTTSDAVMSCSNILLIPGIVRLRDAPYYLGMNKTFFRDAVQPYLTRIPIDKKGIGFSRIELDCWIAYTQATIGQPPKKTPPWEDINQPLQAFSTTQHSKQRKKLIVKKRQLPKKPTAADLEELVKKTISSDGHH